MDRYQSMPLLCLTAIFTLSKLSIKAKNASSQFTMKLVQSKQSTCNVALVFVFFLEALVQIVANFNVLEHTG